MPNKDHDKPHIYQFECLPNILYMFVFCICNVLIIQDTIKGLFRWKLCFLKPFRVIHIIIQINTFLFHQLELSILLECLTGIFKRIIMQISSSCAKLFDIKSKLSINAKFFPSINAIYFSISFGIALISILFYLAISPIFCMMKWLSYPLKLWKTTGIFIFFISSLSLRLHS